MDYVVANEYCTDQEGTSSNPSPIWQAISFDGAQLASDSYSTRANIIDDLKLKVSCIACSIYAMEHRFDFVLADCCGMHNRVG